MHGRLTLLILLAITVLLGKCLDEVQSTPLVMTPPRETMEEAEIEELMGYDEEEEDELLMQDFFNTLLDIEKDFPSPSTSSSDLIEAVAMAEEEEKEEEAVLMDFITSLMAINEEIIEEISREHEGEENQPTTFYLRGSVESTGKGLTYNSEVFYSSSSPLLDSCGMDILLFCNKVQPGNGRIPTCLLKHHDLISDECQALFHDCGKRVIFQSYIARRAWLIQSSKGHDMALAILSFVLLLVFLRLLFLEEEAEDEEGQSSSCCSDLHSESDSDSEEEHERKGKYQPLLSNPSNA